MPPVKKKDKRETVKSSKYQTVLAERDALLKAEVAYKQRIEQLEDDYREVRLEKEKILKEPVTFVNVPYELLVTERDNLLEAEKAYKRTIETLKEEQNEVLSNYAIVYSENKRLRAKMSPNADDDTEPGPNESFSSVMKERDRLLETEKASAKRIKQLEAEAVDLLKSYNNIFGENKLLRSKVESLEDRVGEVSHVEALRLIDLEKEHEQVEDRLKMFKKERKQFQQRVNKLEKENDGLKQRLAEEEKIELKQELRLKIQYLENERIEMKHRIDELEKYPVQKRTKIVKEFVKSKEDEEQVLSLQGQLIAFQVSNKDLNEQMIKMKQEHIEELKKFHKITVDRSTYVSDSDFPGIEEARQRQINNLQREMNDYKRRYEVSQNEITELERLLTKKDKKYQTLEKEKAEMAQKLEDKNAELAEISSFIYAKRGGSKEEMDNLRFRLHELSAEKQALASQLKEDKQLAKDLLKEANEETEKSNKKIKQMETQIKDFTKEMKILHDDTSQLLKTNASQAKEIKTLRAQVEQLQGILDKENERFEKMKNNEREAQEQLKDAVDQLVGARKEIEVLKSNKTLGRLTAEMQSIKMERQEEAETLQMEAERLRGEVKRLKVFEKKMFTMEADMRHMMENKRGLQPAGGSRTRVTAAVSDKDRRELFELRRKVKQVEKEKWDLMKERRAWEGAKTRYMEYQVANRRLTEENKRLREEVGETDERARNFEMKLKASQNPQGMYKDIREVQFAKYVDKEKLRKQKRLLPLITNDKKKAVPQITRSKSPNFATKSRPPRVVVRPNSPKMSPRRDHKRSVKLAEGESGKVAVKETNTSKMLAKKPLLPAIPQETKLAAKPPTGQAKVAAVKDKEAQESIKPKTQDGGAVYLKTNSYSALNKQKKRYKHSTTPLALL